MATSTVPIGNPAGVNQGNPALKGISLTGGSTIPSPIPGGGTPSSTNPYMFSGGMPGGATSGIAPSTSLASIVPTSTPMEAKYASGPQTATSGITQTSADLYKQFTDILGRGEGGALASLYMGMPGTESDIFKQWQTGQAPVWAQQRADLANTLGTAGVSPNSTVEALGLSNLGAQQAAEAGSINAQLMQHNQDAQQNILQNMQNLAAQEQAQSGWDIFGQIAQSVGGLLSPFTGGLSGMAGGLFKNLFTKGAPAADTTNWVGEMAPSTNMPLSIPNVLNPSYNVTGPYGVPAGI